MVPTATRRSPPIGRSTRVSSPEAAKLPADQVRAIPLAGELLPDDATTAMVNLAVIEGVSPGFLVAFPCGTPPPLASNLNFRAGEARAIAAIVGLGPDGDLCVMSNVDVHVIVDVTGGYAPAPAFGPTPALTSLVGHRVADTRTPDEPWSSRFAAGETRRLDPLAGTVFAGKGGAVVLNVVAAGIASPGYVAMYPCDGPVPTVSSLNLMPGSEATNLVPVELGPTGEVCVLSSTATDLVVDLFGVMGPGDDSLAELMSFGGRTTFPDFTRARRRLRRDLRRGRHRPDAAARPAPQRHRPRQRRRPHLGRDRPQRRHRRPRHRRPAPRRRPLAVLLPLPAARLPGARRRPRR